MHIEANLNSVDEDGDTCLHLALNDKIISPDVNQIKQNSTSVDLKDCKLLFMVSEWKGFLILND